MIKLVEKFRLYAQSVPITFASWILSFTGIVLIRMFFEQFSSFEPNHFILIDAPTIIHYGMAYLAVIIILMLVLIFFARTSLKEVSVICIFGFLIILLAPIIDLATGGVGGHIMTYLFLPAKELLLRSITFWGGHVTFGVTLGIQIEAILGIIFCFMYVYSATKKIPRAIGAAITFYLILFFLSATPSIITLFISQQNNLFVSVTQSVNPAQVITGQNDPLVLITKSIITSQIIQNNINPNFTATNLGLIYLGFNKMMIGVSVIIALISSLFLFFLGARKKFIAIFKNSRPISILYFFILLILGTAFAHNKAYFTNWINIQNYVLALIALASAAMFSICQNDIHDEAIDAVSNPNRPLITKELSRNDMDMASTIFFILAIISAYASSLYVLFFTSLSIFIYYIYSNPPFRLKRFVIINSFLAGFACVATIMEGFFLVSFDKNITAFPFGFILATLFFLTIVSNIRDIKDTEGDRADGIKTIPVLIGVKRSKLLIAGIICFFYLLMPWYFHIQSLIVPSIIASVLSWYFINEKNYKDWKAFVIYILYLISIIVFIFLK